MVASQNVRSWQDLVVNQIIAKIMAYQIFGLANFGSQPIRLFACSSIERVHTWNMLTPCTLFFVKTYYTKLGDDVHCE